MENRGNLRKAKPYMENNVPEPGKKRARYAPKACEACRKRKGRCDGMEPCAYCVGRRQTCNYAVNSATPNEWSSDTAVRSPESRIPQNVKDLAWMPEYVRLQVLGGLIAGMQGQLESLAKQAKEPSNLAIAEPTTMTQGTDTSPPKPVDPKLQIELAEEQSAEDIIPQTEPILVPANSSKRVARPFYGPTSPDYSLNVAQMKISTSGPEIEYATIDENNLNDEDSAKGQQTLGKATTQEQPLFRTLLSRREFLHLIYIYQEIIGEFHPIIDVERLVDQSGIWYGKQPCENDTRESVVEAYDVTILSLALAIALWTESPSQRDMAENLYSSCREVVHLVVNDPAVSTKKVVVTLMVGIHHFFKDQLKFAWRMCGLAGRMLMELGLHTREIPNQLIESEQEREEIATLISSVIVLDRQWSAATGLPTNFRECSFDAALSIYVTSPYLKAMHSFTLISDRFSEPIDRVATGGNCDDEDTLEMMNFQIEQWKKKCLHGYDLTNPAAWCISKAKPPSWVILLYLRANAVRALLLRPWFLPKSTTELSKTKIPSGLDLISESIDLLSALDETTDIYRKQLPHFQHILASTCALLFLIVAYIEQHRINWSPEEYSSHLMSVNGSFSKAFRLAATYSNSSLAARRLRNRLKLMRELDFISREDDYFASKPMNSPTGTASASRIRSNRSQSDASLAFTTYDPTDLALPMQPLLMDLTEMGSFTVNSSSNMGPNSLMYDWALGEADSSFPNM
ncbi:hypothetical protein BGW36DRAFT_457402 [Talaromyces proteolyticus]|uniref:Zn(2)-C6 fungal-type domain-containing protein n=1 Tax=Talaromyces proteolyticus TaxID=1131652 RepID=A0AAD4L3S2_9EURO|nr:uncharacterized protein BGW36DRAFT_457402 [Talaromyces proteolyticus]KAH8703032.1 hypothetical protein BGW36DRAFT_457402 [Talaromyces proteolyticus]